MPVTMLPETGTEEKKKKGYISDHKNEHVYFIIILCPQASLAKKNPPSSLNLPLH